MLILKKIKKTNITIITNIFLIHLLASLICSKEQLNKPIINKEKKSYGAFPRSICTKLHIKNPPPPKKKEKVNA